MVSPVQQLRHVEWPFFSGVMGLLLAFVLTGCSCTSPKENAPDGMIYFAGGTFTMGTNNGMMNEAPAADTTVQGFYLSEHPVTVQQFRAFVNATDYTTDAEKYGNAGVFDVDQHRWRLIQGASWHHPRGKNEPKAESNHPVTQISWADARAYCEWKDRRLPTEAEWEYAAKKGTAAGDQYSWGESLVEDSIYRANVWQGQFPDSAAVEDGFLYTSPVGHFGKTPAGLTDMGGNVWEWSADTYHLYDGNPKSMPKNEAYKSIRGGSFLCDSTVCHGYRTTARNVTEKGSANFNLGFRTAKSINTP